VSTAYENGCLPASLMTKREAMATQILAALCTKTNPWEMVTVREQAQDAIVQADALLAMLAGPEAS